MDVIDEFKQRVLEVRDQLEPGMIHGDFNEQNILVDEMNGKSRIKAILDFGDSHYSCYLYELAIAMTYIMLLKRDIRVGGHVIAGYLNVKPISDTELLKVRNIYYKIIIQKQFYIHFIGDYLFYNL